MQNYQLIGCKSKKQNKIYIYIYQFWIIFRYGYDGNKEQTKTLYALSEHEILYVIGSVCIIL